MQSEKYICYLYGSACEVFVEQFKSVETDERIVYQIFSENDSFPELDYDVISHLVVTGTLTEIKTVLEMAKNHQLSAGIVPLSEQNRLSKILDMPKKPKEAFLQAIRPSEKKVDLFYCNETLVLSEVRIGNASVLKEYEFHYSKYSFLKRIKLFWHALRKKNFLKHHKFTVTTAKEEKITFSAIGMLGLEYNNFSWISTLLKKQLSAQDSQNILLILAPTSLLQYYIISPLTLLFRKWNAGRLPSSCGYIKSSHLEVNCEETVKVVIDDEEMMKTPVLLETQGEALALSVGVKFWEQQIAEKTDRNSVRLDNIPKDEETINSLKEGLPLFSHASKERYTALFTSLRDEGEISSTFVILLILATVIATLGLFINSSSVIIGAMILAPLMQPIVSLSMGVLRRDESLSKNGMRTIVIGVIITLFTAMFIAYLTPIREMSSEMMARLSPTILDMLIAIASGVAAAYAKNDEKISGSLAGVAIAVALVPPLAVSGIGIGWGDYHMFFNALLLFMTNLIGIVLAGALTFLFLGFAPIHVAKKGIIIWSLITLLIAVPLYHSFETMEEGADIRSALLHVKFDINGKSVYLNKIEYQPKGEKAEVRCEVIINEKLERSERDYLHKLIAKVVGKPTDVIATFRYRL
ncbi:MAG: TIGR00341 family protein [Campylobacterota bacterium]|nr:TIGR00341 family protein [Campylobacterota bacterium]